MTSPKQTELPETADKRTIGELVAAISGQFSALLRGEIELAKLNLKEKGARFAVAGGVFVGAAVLALYMLSMLLHAAAWGIAATLPVWAGYLIVAGILLVIIVILGLVGVAALKKSEDYEVHPQDGLKKTVDAAKMGFEK